MRTPDPAAGTTPPRPGRGAFNRAPVLVAAPAVAVAVYGALWIVLHAGGGRGLLPRLAAAGLAAAVGTYLRARHNGGGHRGECADEVRES